MHPPHLQPLPSETNCLSAGHRVNADLKPSAHSCRFCDHILFCVHRKTNYEKYFLTFFSTFSNLYLSKRSPALYQYSPLKVFFFVVQQSRS